MESNEDKLTIDYGGVAISIVSLIISLAFGLCVSYYQVHEFPWFSKHVSEKTRNKINFCAKLQKMLGLFAVLSIIFVIVSTLYSNSTSDYPFYEYDIRYWAGTLILTVEN